MKKFFLIFFLITPTLAFTQISVPIFSYNYGTVTFNNGDTLEGYIMVKTNYDIKYKKEYDSPKKNKFKNEELNKLTYGSFNYFFKKVKKNSSYDIKALELFIEGEINLYREVYKRTMPGSVGGSNRIVPNNAEVRYYIGNKDQVEVINLGFGNSYSNKFNKIAVIYFRSCDSLINKIKNREFERFDIPGIVNYYNNECSK